jgi:hypothetical protein
MPKDYDVLHYCGPLVLDSRYEWLCFGVSSMRIQMSSFSSSRSVPASSLRTFALLSRSSAVLAPAAAPLATSSAATAIRPERAETAKGRTLATGT